MSLLRLRSGRSRSSTPGVELLRSKSLDRNSYNSGDWFNRLDFTDQTNNWGVGLPPAPDNQANWPVMAPLLANPALRPSSEDIRRARAHVLEAFAIRRSSPLFRLRTAAEVQKRLRFHNTGPSQMPGLIAFGLSGEDEAGRRGSDHDGEEHSEGRDEDHGDHPGERRGEPHGQDHGEDRGHEGQPFARVVVLLNASPAAQTLVVPDLAGERLRLHPILRESADPVVRTASFERSSGTFTVPGRTAAVFVAAGRHEDR